jgi:hypothetical protein
MVYKNKVYKDLVYKYLVLDKRPYINMYMY